MHLYDHSTHAFSVHSLTHSLTRASPAASASAATISLINTSASAIHHQRGVTLGDAAFDFNKACYFTWVMGDNVNSPSWPEGARTSQDKPGRRITEPDIH